MKIESMLNGEPDRSPPEFTLAELAAAIEEQMTTVVETGEGWTTREIAESLGYDPFSTTAREKTRQVLRKLMRAGKLERAAPKMQETISGSQRHPAYRLVREH